MEGVFRGHQPERLEAGLVFGLEGPDRGGLALGGLRDQESGQQFLPDNQGANLLRANAAIRLTREVKNVRSLADGKPQVAGQMSRR